VKNVGTYIALAILVVFILAPVVWLAVLSIKPETAILGAPFAPFTPTLEHYVTLFEQFRFGPATQTSLLIAAIVLGITLPISSLAAYGLARFQFRGIGAILVWLLFCRIMVPAILVLPMYDLISFLGLMGSVWGIVLGHLAWSLPFAILILQSFCQGMPKIIEEAAWLDGLSRWRTFWRIVFPLMGPGIAIAGLFTFGTSWGEFLFAVAFTTNVVRTGPVQISLMTTDYKVWWGALAASGIYWSIPMIVVAVMFNRHMTRGLRLGF